ncbi:hypothetical protein A3K63_00275 [Candidatus Micrarchaeota archaeon RBG_16_49_10]|nr:MAG: hypothetical protein A3K63_00275 [Candidatus Micrarchaeota archaeon RBG_16_49_10]
MSDLNKLIKAKVKEGKVIMGYGEVLKLLKTQKLKKVVYANNLPADKIKMIEHNSKISKTDIEEYQGNGMDLGLVCGKPFSVGVIAIKGSEK